MVEDHDQAYEIVQEQEKTQARESSNTEDQSIPNQPVEHAFKSPLQSSVPAITSTVQPADVDKNADSIPRDLQDGISERVLRSHNTSKVVTSMTPENITHIAGSIHEEFEPGIQSSNDGTRDQTTLAGPLSDSAMLSPAIDLIQMPHHVPKAETDQVKYRVHRDIRRTSDALLKTMAETRDKCALLTEKFDESLVHVKELGEQLQKIESNQSKS